MTEMAWLCKLSRRLPAWLSLLWDYFVFARNPGCGRDSTDSSHYLVEAVPSENPSQCADKLRTYSVCRKLIRSSICCEVRLI